jgi:hypothetical protein
LFRRKALEPPADIEGRKDLGEEDRAAQDQQHRGENDRHRARALLVTTSVAIAAEDRNKRHRRRTADKKIRDHVGELEGGIEGVGLRARSEEVGDVLHAHKADDSREEG